MVTEISTFAEMAFYLWVLSEIAILIKTKSQRKNVASENKDRGTFWVIIGGIFTCIIVNQLCNAMKIGFVGSTFSTIGSVLIIMGVGIRLWAVVVLGRHFSLVVSVDSKQEIVKSGPYRVVRHPSYTGALLTFIGIGLAFNTWVGSVIMVAFFILVFGYRMRVEEKALKEGFPEDYPRYIEKTARVIPFIW